MHDSRENDKLRELLKLNTSIAPGWLDQQRNRLMGAITHADDKPLFSRLYAAFSDQLQYLTIPRLATAAALLILGFFLGRYQSPELEPQSLTLADLIDGGQISAVQLDPAGSHGDQFRFLLTTQENIAVNGAKNDSEAIQLIHYMLENTQDPEDRKELVETLSKSNLSSDLAVTALSKALLTEKDPEIQNTLIESIAGQDQPIVKEALLGIVMGEYAESVRLKALEILEKFMDDAYIRNMLSIVAATDEIQTIRDKARQMLMKIKQTKSSIEKKDFEGEIK